MKWTIKINPDTSLHHSDNWVRSEKRETTPFIYIKCYHYGTNELAKCISHYKSEEKPWRLFQYLCLFQEISGADSYITIGKKIGRKLGALQRTSALREAKAGRMKVLFSNSLQNSFIQKEISV